MVKRQVALVWAACLVALASGCKGCAARKETAAEQPDGGIAKRASPEPPATVTLIPRMQAIGDPDYDYRYNSTVALQAVSPPDGLRYGGCSGVLIAPNLVLTAAHCLCAPTRGQTIRFDGSACAAKAEVCIHTSLPRVESHRTSTDLRRTGNVLIHPRFEIVLDKQGTVVTSRADLAVIRLEQRLPPDAQPAPVRLATEDLLAPELVTIAGFAVYDDGKPECMIRTSIREEVWFSAGEDRNFFGDRDPHSDYNGDTGGPCLRETDQGRELIGISQRALSPKPALTRIVPHRDWLEEQIRLAKGNP